MIHMVSFYLNDSAREFNNARTLNKKDASVNA